MIMVVATTYRVWLATRIDYWGGGGRDTRLICFSQLRHKVGIVE